MVNVFETIISCRFCNGVKRINHLKREVSDEDLEGWKRVKDTRNIDRYLCSDCIKLINSAVDLNKKASKPKKEE